MFNASQLDIHQSDQDHHWKNASKKENENSLFTKSDTSE